MKVFFLLMLLFTCRCWAQSDIEVERSGDGMIQVQAQVFAPAPPEVAWGVLTDYEHLAAFVPDMTSSRVVSAPGEPVRVEQKGSTSFLLFSFPLEVVFEIEAVSSRELRFRAIAGNLHDMTGAYRLEAADSGTRIHYETRFRPDFWVPPLVSTGIMRREIKRQFDGLVREIARRNATLHEIPPTRVH